MVIWSLIDFLESSCFVLCETHENFLVKKTQLLPCENPPGCVVSFSPYTLAQCSYTLVISGFPGRVEKKKASCVNCDEVDSGQVYAHKTQTAYANQNTLCALKSFLLL